MDSFLFLKRTRIAYVATRVMDTPFWAIYNMLPVILYKDLHATPLQLAVIIALKPLVSLLSMYWSSSINARPDRLVSNIVFARILGYLPFFFFPIFNNSWFFIASFGFYMMLAVGITPAWMEILKLNIPKQSREKVFSYSQAFGYMGGGLLPFALGFLLDEYFQSWRWLFPVAAFIGLSALIFQVRILIPDNTPISHQKFNLKEHALHPWKTAWNLLKERPDFRRFEIGSMIISSGLMVIQPALPIYFVDTLHLSYTEIALAITLCKGFGFALASPFWSKWLHKIDIYSFSSWIAGLGVLFPFFMFLTQWELGALWCAYICYGVMQSGNELIWNMSGPFFAKEKDSSPFTSVNIVAIGLRGCFIPFLGSALTASFGAASAMLLSAFLCCLAIFPLMSYRKTNAEKDFDAL